MQVHSIFESINGEITASHQGRMCTFIRLAGCNLRCSYCDTAYAQEAKSGKEMTVEEIVKEVAKNGHKHVTITGGEPLDQKDIYTLVKALDGRLDQNKYLVTIETNGSIKPDFFNVGVFSWVVDYKLPSSGMEKFMNLENFSCNGSTDFVKFVISDFQDLERALMVKKQIEKLRGFPGTFAFSPCQGKTDVRQLFEWLQEKNIKDAIINVQLHKIVDMP